jgi:hypothetical protein
MKKWLIALGIVLICSVSLRELAPYIEWIVGAGVSIALIAIWFMFLSGANE